ncbi:YidH family protein [Tundrisphaera sp. TA3]|uniref:YidH family protein n=1 Tax=Tundrisphaera sp. TA3 TaxID=3435775 RepID=UPI003EC04CEA
MGNDPETPEDPRVRFAAERTLLAWIRTGLAMMGFGFVVARFGLFLREMAATGRVATANPSGLSFWIGTGLVIFGVAVNVMAAIEHARVLGGIGRGEPYRPPRLSLGIVVAAGLSLLGLAMVVYLARLSV